MATKNTKKPLNEDVMTRNILNKLRTSVLRENNAQRTNAHLLRENASASAIAITNDPKFGQEVLKNQIDEFRTTVDGGTQFTQANPSDPTSSPLVYYPENGNLTFSGIIPSLNNLQWQFSLKDQDGTGLFVWPSERGDDSNSDNQGKAEGYKGFRLNKENLQLLNKLHGHYLNWKSQWEQSSSMLQNLAKKDE